MNHVLKAASIHVNAFYPTLFSKVLGENKTDIDQVILSSGSAGVAAGAAAPAAAGAAVASDAKEEKKEEKKEEEEEEDGDLGLDLFG